jgi:hypothetical protein
MLIDVSKELVASMLMVEESAVFREILICLLVGPNLEGVRNSVLDLDADGSIVVK